jgi:hypothetical protein
MKKSKEIPYTEEVSEILRKAGIKSPESHRSLRCIFDPLSSEWSEQSNMDEKVAILSALIAAGVDLDHLALKYRIHHDSVNRTDISSTLTSGLAKLLQYVAVQRLKDGQ